jgi:hypothetical protein
LGSRNRSGGHGSRRRIAKRKKGVLARAFEFQTS